MKILDSIKPKINTKRQWPYKNYQVTMAGLTEEEFKKFKEIAKSKNMNNSEFLRSFVRLAILDEALKTIKK